MDFIERIFNVSPDGGSGSLEFILLLVAAAIAYFAVVPHQRVSKSRLK
jgi:hypothetical protein